MGYFGNGFVFTSEPDFESAARVVPSALARGYKHQQHAVWLLDLWKPRRTVQLRHWPFCDPAADGFRLDPAGFDGATRGFLVAFEGLQKAIGWRHPGAEISSVHVTLAVAKAAGCPTFFFAADDDETDVGCNAISGSLVSFGCRLGRLSVQHASGHTTLTPLNAVEDGHESELEQLIEAVNTVAGISVLPPRDIEGGELLYENPVGHWPKAAGDPADILGLGTWDPFLNIEEDFVVTFENLSP